MKNPWVIGILSIVPGLGLIVLGKVGAGIGAAVTVAFFAIEGLIAHWEAASIIGYTLAIIAWGSQMYYAVLYARQLDRVEAGLTPPTREVSIAPLSPAETSIETATPTASAGQTQGFGSDHPVLLSALIGAGGGLLGVVAGAILSMILAVAIIAILPSTDDNGEGLGYLIGFYCFIMFPFGGAIIGAIPGAVVGALRNSQDSEFSPIPPLLAGLVTVVILTLVSMMIVLVGFF